MQQYSEVADTLFLSDSRGPFLNNDKTIMSNSSGVAFPTTNLQVGMLCYRTDLLKLYQCTDSGLPVWKLIFDLNNTATDKEYVDAVAATKQNTITGAVSNLVTSNLTANRAVATDASGKVTVVTGVTDTHLSYLANLVGNVQTQLDGKSSTSHNHDGIYAPISHAHASYVNQNAFSNIAVSGQVTASADTPTDTLTFVPGTNMSSITIDDATDTITFNASTQSVGLSAVGQSQLKTAIGTVSTTYANNVQLTLPGGQYGFYPQTYFNDNNTGNDTGSQTAWVKRFVSGTLNSQDVWQTVIGLDNYKSDYSTQGGYAGASARQRHITSSPPYNLGNGDIPLFVFGTVDTATGDIIDAYIAEAPPWAYNGPTDIRADFYKNGVGYKNKITTETNWVPDGLGDFEPVMTRKEELIEVTHAVKNADIGLIPHPFAGNNLTGKVVVMLDPLSSVTDAILSSLLSGNQFVHEMVHEYIKVDNTPRGFNASPGVMGVGVKWK